MNIFLAGTRASKEIRQQSLFCLDSFYELNPKKPSDASAFKDYLLDSGAFTFMHSGKTVVWEEYLERYADYVKRNNIKNFIELDIDKFVGYDKVLELRKRLESYVGRQCMPVWHPNRGKDEFIKMTKEYKYACLGGLVACTTVQRHFMEKFFQIFIDEAHRNGCRLHGLGFTSLKKLPEYHFDSVDSTSWLSGGRYGTMYKFTGNTLKAK